MSITSMNNVINEIQELSKSVKNVSREKVVEGREFANILTNQINKVAELQQEAELKQEKFAMGDKDTSLPDVMVSMQKADINTQLMIETRNKVISAYTEIMNMNI